MSTDDALRAMFTAYEGPSEPAARRTRRSVTARTVVLLVAAVAICGALVPAGRALVRTFFETPQQFVGDTSQPARARALIHEFLTHNRGLFPNLTGVEPELVAHTPTGKVGIYGLTFAGGRIGVAVIGLGASHLGGLWAGREIECPPGWAIKVRGSSVASPGHTPVLIEGRVSSVVSSLDVEREDGRIDHAAIGNGYFLAWITPKPNGAKPSATLIARNGRGAQIGALHVTDGGLIQPSLAESNPNCG